MTVGQTSFTLTKLLTHALRRAKIPGQGITSEHLQIAKECLSLTLTALHNEKMPMWCQEALLLPMYENEEQVVLPAGTMDILKAFYRQLPRVGDSYDTNNGGVASNLGDGDLTTSLTQTAINGSVVVQFLSNTVVTIVGIMPNGNQFYNLVFEASNDGVTYTLVQTISPPAGETATSYENKRWTWYEILTPPTALFFRVRETGGGTLNLRELVLSSAPSDTLMYRMNRDQYTLQPNKKVRGSRPLQFWMNRQLDRPIMYLWPMAAKADSLNCIYLWRQRYIADVGDFDTAIELPVRWYDAICWRVASYCAAEIPEAAGDPVALMQMAALPLSAAISEERDRSPIILRPNLRRYTR